MKNTLKGSLSLLLGTVLWGSAFVAQSVGMDHVGPFTFQAVRCVLAVIGLLPVIGFFDRGKQDGKTFLSRFADKKLWKAGILCGIPLFFAVNLQQMALVDVDAGKAAFLTAMYIIFVPIIGLILGKKPSPMIPVSVILAVCGLYFLSCMGVSSVQTGDLLLLGCALAFSIQITVVDHFAPEVDALRMNCIQSLVCAVISTVIMFLTETPTWEGIWNSFGPMCYAGFLSLGIAYSLQIIGQKHLEASVASLIMSLESVFGALFGWMLLGERMTSWELLGCGLLFTAVILCQIPIRKKADKAQQQTN